MTMVETNDVSKLEFKWGKKRGVGGRKKEIQFYESFTYDGVDYSLYDTVYIHKEGEAEPYIGKIIEIWENEDKKKQVRLQWFFRPCEISKMLGGVRVLEKEIFLASGEGTGLANNTPLEGISGKCNVVCTSKDIRNHQPSAEEIKLADYIFYRTFDVQLYTMLDMMGDKVGELEVRFVFNRKGSETACVRELESHGKDAVACDGEQKFSMAVNDVKDVSAKYENLTDAKPASVLAGELKKSATAIGQEACLMGEKINASKAKAVNNVLERDSTVAGKAEKDDLMKPSVDRSLRKEMKRSHVEGGTVKLPIPYCIEFLPKVDTTLILEDDAEGRWWEVLYLAERNSLSRGWGRFVQDNGINYKDIVFFDLVEENRFKIKILRDGDGDNDTLAIAKSRVISLAKKKFVKSQGAERSPEKSLSAEKKRTCDEQVTGRVKKLKIRMGSEGEKMKQAMENTDDSIEEKLRVLIEVVRKSEDKWKKQDAELLQIREQLRSASFVEKAAQIELKEAKEALKKMEREAQIELKEAKEAFKQSSEFKKIVEQKAVDILEKGYVDFLSFVGEGNQLNIVDHSWGRFLAAKGPHQG